MEDEERNRIIELLNERLESHDNNRKEVQDKLREICDGMRKQIDYLESSINGEVEKLFSKEDNRLQSALNGIREYTSTDDNETLRGFQRARAELLAMQSYELVKCSMDNGKKLCITKACELKVERKLVPLKSVGFEERKPMNFTPSLNDKGNILLFFAFFNDDEIRVLQSFNFSSNVVFAAWEKGTDENFAKVLTKEYKFGEQVYFANQFSANTTYYMKMRIEHQGLSSKWSDKVEFTTLNVNACIWKECPDNVNEKRKYFINENNPRVATKTISAPRNHCTIIGSTPLCFDTVISWNIKILKSEKNDGDGIYIGVAPFNTTQNEDDKFNKRGWYFSCFYSALHSGRPHNYRCESYGPRKTNGQYVRTGDIIGVIMDTTRGDLSFVINGVNLAVAFEGIPLDEPLAPCVILEHGGDSIELDISEPEEDVNKSFFVPAKIMTKSVTWDSITLTWNGVDGASFYQIEIDEVLSSAVITKNEFTINKLLPGSTHSFRLRAVKNNAVSEWSIVAREKVMKAPEFSNSMWKECPGYVNNLYKYSVDLRSSKTAYLESLSKECTIIGNTPLPTSEVTSWGIKIIKSKWFDGNGIFIGVAPYDINQNESENQIKCGWYFCCYDSTLHSGPPHNHRGVVYGPRNKIKKYVYTGDTAGVMVDTIKGILSFGLKGKNLGIAYERISLDKALVPCVILKNKNDSVKLCLYGDDESCVIS